MNSNSESPFVSVVIPVYNDLEGVKSCLEALARQSYPGSNFEVIVVDNNSPRPIAPEIQRFEFARCVVERRQGSYAARNAGIREARGELLGFTDADCIPDENWITRAVQCFVENPPVGGVAGGIISAPGETWVGEVLCTWGFQSQDGTLKHPFLPYAQTANAWYRREVFDIIGLFEPGWVSGGDADLAWRMQLKTSFSISHVPEAAVVHRHRATLKSLFKQCWKWGYGQAALSRKYNQLKAIKSSENIFNRLYSIAHLAAFVTARSFQETFWGRDFEQKPEHIVRLALKTGLELGRICGKVSKPPQKSRKW